MKKTTLSVLEWPEPIGPQSKEQLRELLEGTFKNIYRFVELTVDHLERTVALQQNAIEEQTKQIQRLQGISKS